MHVLYFHQYFSIPAGADGTRSYEMARALIERGHEVTMVCGSSSLGKTGLTGEPRNGMLDGEVDGIRVIELCLPYCNYDSLVKRSLIFMKFAWRSIGIAWKTKYDLLFATSTPLTAGIPGIAMRFLKPSKPFVFEVRDLWPELPRAMGVVTNPAALWAMSVLEWLSYHCASACVGLAPGIIRGIRCRCPNGKTIAMIPNACDLEMFQAPDNPSARKVLRAAFTGAHGMANGLDAVLDAAKVLKDRGRADIELFFIGDGKLKPALMARAEQEELNNCRFLDPVPKTKLTLMLRDMDVGLMILANVPEFYYGTSPNKFFDYIASGLPVLNNYPGWLADIIARHECGIAVPPDNPGALADALVCLAENPGLRERMGRNARRLAEAEFDRQELAAQFVDLLENLGIVVR